MSRSISVSRLGHPCGRSEPQTPKRAKGRPRRTPRCPLAASAACPLRTTSASTTPNCAPPLAPRPLDPPPVRLHRLLLLRRVVVPLVLPPLRFRDVGPRVAALTARQRLVLVVT